MLVHTLMEIDPRFPAVNERAAARRCIEVKEALEAQAPEGAAPDPFEEQRAGRGTTRGGSTEAA